MGYGIRKDKATSYYTKSKGNRTSRNYFYRFGYAIRQHSPPLIQVKLTFFVVHVHLLPLTTMVVHNSNQQVAIVDAIGACWQYSHNAIFHWNLQKHSNSYMLLFIDECVWNFQNNAFWDTNLHALFLSVCCNLAIIYTSTCILRQFSNRHYYRIK